MKLRYMFAVCGIFTIFIIAFLIFEKEDIKETIIFFPIDRSAAYVTANTSLTASNALAPGGYSVRLRSASVLDRHAYLRQDLSFVFKDGRLREKMGKWEPNTDRIVQEEVLQEKESALYSAVSFHYSEIHKNEESIFSAQMMSSDFIYTVSSPISPVSAFRVPFRQEDVQWKGILDKGVEMLIENTLNKAADSYGINKNDYYIFRLTELARFETSPFPGFSRQATDKAIGRLWEGLYKNYFLGIKKRDGTVINPVDSTIPVILLSKDKKILLVLIQPADGDLVILKQEIQDSR
ncbi:hypothetical protein [Mesobacillus zeae]|uniref:Uncharacterized protein n=1 Tax=Mesobacillus zeae TaxID=1917180 RepID=A0A398B272_9BACI|nr:hypothetical protein [Mesobacillus zeae]RID83852.1 hypothetical protein D1970_14705 [Mesobacillus zeae]